MRIMKYTVLKLNLSNAYPQDSLAMVLTKYEAVEIAERAASLLKNVYP